MTTLTITDTTAATGAVTVTESLTTTGVIAGMPFVVASTVGGISAANFLTPVLVDTLNITNIKHQNGIAFIAGFLGLKLVEIVSEKFLEKISNKTKPKKTTKRKKR